ncbi:MAG: UDP-N-acetylmuramoyl-tripeptide--D-alanyl-D-alanine ligase [Bacteroidota bacterium]
MNIAFLLELFRQSGRVSTDTRKIQNGDLFFALKGANFNGNLFAAQALEAGASHVVIDDPDVHQPDDKRYILVKDSLRALQELSRAWRRTFDIPIIGITGSNGKTTTKELMYAVLATEKKAYATAGNFNNHIGVPLTLLAMPADTEIAIIEMGANQPGDIAELADIAEPTHGLITNIGRAHLEKLINLEGVRQTKGALFDFVEAHQGYIFLNQADPRLVQTAQSMTSISTYGTPESICHGEVIARRINGMDIRVQHQDWDEALIFSTHLTGDYNAHNILAAISIGVHFGISTTAMQAGIRSYVPTNNRSQLIEKGGKRILLDAYNANPSSMRAAIENIFSHQKKTGLILGDMLELGEEAESIHAEIGQLVKKCQPLVMIGVGPLMQAAVQEAGPQAHAFDNVASLLPHLGVLLADCEMVLIKGSRGIALERLMDYI